MASVYRPLVSFRELALNNEENPSNASIAHGIFFAVTGSQAQRLAIVGPKDGLSDPDPGPSPAAMIARTKALELDTPYVAPPGDPLVNHAAGFAKMMCSAVFITGIDPQFAAENVDYFTAPYEVRARLGKPVVDREHKQVHVAVPAG
jgi:hypothetical protein